MKLLLASHEADGSWFVANAPLAIDCDGSPHAYHPDNVSGLDDLRNGGPISAPYGYELNPHTGKPYIQGDDAPAYDASSRGFYVSATTYQRSEFLPHNPRRYLNAEKESFGVVPGWFRRQVVGIVIGCRMTITYRGITIEAVAGDVGPAFGEASISAAKRLGINANGRSGGVPAGVDFRIWPGIPAVVDGLTYQLQRAG